MKINTRIFGEMEVNEEKTITFPKGIIAFENLKRYIIIENEDKEIPLQWLQSLDDPSLAFVIINPFYFKKDYEIDIPKGVLEELALIEKEEVVVFSIVVIPEDMSKMTANLLAPIIINTKNSTGRQIILNDSRYKTKHLILEEIKKAV